MTGQKFIFLDIDGTVSGLSLGSMQDHWPDAESITLHGFPLNLSKRMGEELTALKELATIIWVSTWESQSLDVGEAMGLVGCEALVWMNEFYEPEHQSTIPGKACAIRKWMFEKGQKANPNTLWVDDELLGSKHMIGRTSDRFLAPRRATGLLHEDILFMESWAVGNW